MGAHRSYRERRYAFGQRLLTLRTRTALTQIELAGTLAPQIDAAAATPAPAAAGKKPPLVLKSSELTGKLLFDAEAGRLVSAEQQQTLATQRPYRETTIDVKLTSTQTSTLSLKREDD